MFLLSWWKEKKQVNGLINDKVVSDSNKCREEDGVTGHSRKATRESSSEEAMTF